VVARLAGDRVRRVTKIRGCRAVHYGDQQLDRIPVRQEILDPGSIFSSLIHLKEIFAMRNRSSLLTAFSLVLASLLLVAHANAQCTWTGTATVLTTPCTVGIGTTTPNFPLEVVKDGGNAQLSGSAFSASGGAINFLGRGARGTFASPQASQANDFFMVMGGRGYTGSGFATANSSRIAFRAESNFTATTQGGFITFDTVSAADPGITLTERMRVMSDGTILIGRTTKSVPPAGFSNVKLDVNGDILTSGNVNVKYQDVAEWVPVSEQMSAGTVVVLNRSKSNEVTASTRAYDTAVAGVVSARPGVVLGEPGDSKEKIATTGRVKVHADATKHAIQVGDLLVTSDVTGMAMRSEPIEVGGRSFHQPGTIIGKALESLDHGQGEVLVLLSLQ
jgi:hypothetical protein